MPQFELQNRLVIPAFNAATALQSWLRPGLLAYIMGAHAEQLRPHAVRLFAERAAMLDTVALKHPDVIPDGEPDAGKPNPLAGQLVERIDANGVKTNPFLSAEAGREFIAREHELMSANALLTVDERLTFELLKRLDAERLATPRSVDGQPVTDDSTAVDFAALMPLILRAAEPPLTTVDGAAHVTKPGAASSLTAPVAAVRGA